MKIQEMTLTSNWLVKDSSAEKQDKQREVAPILGNESNIKVSISEEGQNAYRNSLNNLEGYTPSSLEELFSHMEEAKIWASGKFDMDVTNSLYIEMKQLEGGRISYIKDRDGSYDLFDVAHGTLEAYAIMYDKLVQGHKDGTREVYTNFADEQTCRLVTLEEDLAFLDKALTVAWRMSKVISMPKKLPHGPLGLI